MNLDQLPPAGPDTPKEPPADMRVAAAAMRRMFLALTAEGFTEAQALKIIGTAITAGINGNNNP